MIWQELPLADPSTRAIAVLVAVALLVAGRRLFWLAVGSVGFLLGLAVTTRLVSGLPTETVWVVAVAGGLFGCLLALFIQKVAVGVAGFLLGLQLGDYALALTPWDPGAWESLVLIGVALASGLVAIRFLEPALALVTATAGAALLVRAVVLPGPLEALLFLGLLAIGFVIQSSGPRRSLRSRN